MSWELLSTPIDAKVNNGWTPLHIAVNSGITNMAELLIAKNADVNAKDKDGHTPLWHAKDRRRTELVELLRKQGAKE